MKLKREHYDIAMVVGNGFDLNLGLKTSYTDFIESDYFKEMINSGNKFARHLANEFSLNDWIDVENELKIYSKNSGTSRNDFLTEFKELSNSLKLYLMSLKYDELDEKREAYKILSENQEKSILIIDFNYTSTISKILRELDVRIDEDDCSIEHIKIHGSIKSSNIIFGVEDKALISPQHIFLKKSVNEDFYPTDFSEAIKNCKYFIVFGHSLGETDHMYFDDFFFEASHKQKGKNGQTMILYYYGENSFYNINSQLDKLTLQSINLLKRSNSVQFLNLMRSDRLLG